MSCQCGCGMKKRSKLCPVSFGLALGIVSALVVFLFSLYAINYGPTAMMVAHQMPVPSMVDAGWCALWTLLYGFIFGFFLALFYDLISCCCKSKCCRSRCGSGCNCGPDCACGCNKSKANG